jgi:hypothetical protein
MFSPYPKEETERYVVVLILPGRIGYLLHEIDSTVVHYPTPYTIPIWHDWPISKNSLSCIITCTDPEIQWNEERFLASLARSVLDNIAQDPHDPSWTGLAASRDTFAGPYTDLKDVRLYSHGNETLKSMPRRVSLAVISYFNSPWFHETAFFKQMILECQPALFSHSHTSEAQAILPDVTHEQPASMTIQCSPATSLAAFSPASFVTARSTPRSAFTSPAFMTAQSTPTFVQTNSVYLNTNMYGSLPTQFDTIQEVSVAHVLPPQLLKLKREYLECLNEKNLLQSLDSEVNWSGKGQHVTFHPAEDVPLKYLGHLGASISATVNKVLCRRVELARKPMRCTPRFKVVDALVEVTHLQKLRHFHIVQLVGSYLHGRDFSILMYPVADYHLGKFLDDTADMLYADERYAFLTSVFGCLASAFKFIHKNSTKHMDVKPQNILVRQHRAREDWSGWRVYIADFGLSRDYKAQGHSQTDGRTFLTPRYCSPEVYNFELRGRSADVFSLGCVFLEILTVLAYEHPDDFAEFRSRERDNDSFHANLDRVALWVEKHLEQEFQQIDPSVREKVEMMVKTDPYQRPTALELVEFFSGLPELNPYKTKADCCSRPPEPYIPAAVAPGNRQCFT